MMRLIRPLCLVLLLCVAMPALLGCAPTSIREDSVQERLPAIDPTIGRESEQQLTIYFRLHAEDLLAPVYRTIRVGPRDDVARIVVETLLEGPQEHESLLAPVLPSATELLDVSRDGDTVSVTFSRSFLNSASAGTREAQQLRQRLQVYAVVNSLCALEGVKYVQILVDTANNGIGARVPPFLLGFRSGEIADRDVGALERDPAYSVTPQTCATLALKHLKAQEYEAAYALFASKGADAQKPTLDIFIEQFQATTIITDYKVGAFLVKDNAPNEITLDLTWTTREGVHVAANDMVVALRSEQNVQLLEYHALLQAMKQGREVAGE